MKPVHINPWSPLEPKEVRSLVRLSQELIESLGEDELGMDHCVSNIVEEL